ncbi:hypothetical protein SALBM311S_11795 [Streptomyces alboniger]
MNPADGYNSKAHVLPLARRLKRAGVGIWIDFHYSDSWADPAHQTKPTAWAGLDVAGLSRAISARPMCWAPCGGRALRPNSCRSATS